ncbi:XRE family transcriptional regulator [Cytobacillus sp. FJAT-53684]|uniref:XRE family transcriptional regulator n=1 Tax=Cytobacillus mangrovibacter TaxID=3299024 RepID=A0ABW6K1A3_9BACI
MSVAGAVQRLLDEEGLTQVQMALDLFVSEQLVSHIKNGRRKMVDDVAKRSLEIYDNPFYSIDVLHEFGDRCSPPVFRGNSVEQHRLAFEEVTIHEALEAIDILNEVSFVRNPSQINKEERDRVKQAIGELLDVEAWARNLAALLCSEYKISWKDSYKKRVPIWKSKGWIQ